MYIPCENKHPTPKRKTKSEKGRTDTESNKAHIHIQKNETERKNVIIDNILSRKTEHEKKRHYVNEKNVSKSDALGGGKRNDSEDIRHR